jgi:hypothetical protein
LKGGQPNLVIVSFWIDVISPPFVRTVLESRERFRPNQ